MSEVSEVPRTHAPERRECLYRTSATDLRDVFDLYSDELDQAPTQAWIDAQVRLEFEAKMMEAGSDGSDMDERELADVIRQATATVADKVEDGLPHRDPIVRVLEPMNPEEVPDDHGDASDMHRDQNVVWVQAHPVHVHGYPSTRRESEGTLLPLWKFDVFAIDSELASFSYVSVWAWVDGAVYTLTLNTPTSSVVDGLIGIREKLNAPVYVIGPEGDVTMMVMYHTNKRDGQVLEEILTDRRCVDTLGSFCAYAAIISNCMFLADFDEARVFAHLFSGNLAMSLTDLEEIQVGGDDYD